MALQGNYDHPSYLTRQMTDLDVSTAGSTTVSAACSFVSNVRIRKAVDVVRVAGTTAGTIRRLIYVGTSVTGYNTPNVALTTTTTTATLGSITLSTATASSVTTYADMNTLLVAGGYLAVQNGTDATGTGKTMLELYLDPSATWTGPPGS
jgi:hypothetical protein